MVYHLKMSASKTFKAVLERFGGQLNWTVIRAPFDVHKVWGVRGQLRVRGEINGFPFNSCLFPTKAGRHFMIINKKMQAGARVKAPQTARFRMEPDVVERVITVPRELAKALGESKRLVKYYESLNFSTRREIADSVGAGKQPETRTRRAERFAELLMQTMDAERGDLPPILEIAFRQNPAARRGWNKMPPSHKRQHLFGIFYYRNPESQSRRVAKAVEAMLAYAER